MTLPAPGSVPPTTVSPISSRIPAPELGTAVVPVASTPIRFPWIRLPVAVPLTWMPLPDTPEITLPAPGSTPPTRLSDAEVTITPLPDRPTAPDASVPM